MITVTGSTDVPVFDQTEYKVSFPENVQDRLPRMVVDLDTSDEKLGRKLNYYMINNDYEGSNDVIINNLLIVFKFTRVNNYLL